MVYKLTDKLKIEETPEIEIRGKKVTVKADAETVLSLISILQEEGETQATIKAFDLLFSDKDKKTISNLKLSFENYTKLLEVAISLALGEDPDNSEQE